MHSLSQRLSRACGNVSLWTGEADSRDGTATSSVGCGVCWGCDSSVESFFAISVIYTPRALAKTTTEHIVLLNRSLLGFHHLPLGRIL